MGRRTNLAHDRDLVIRLLTNTAHFMSSPGCKNTPTPSSSDALVEERRQRQATTHWRLLVKTQHWPRHNPSFHSRGIGSRVVSSSLTRVIELGKASDIPLARPNPEDVSKNQVIQYGPFIDKGKPQRPCRVLWPGRVNVEPASR